MDDDGGDWFTSDEPEPEPIKIGFKKKESVSEAPPAAAAPADAAADAPAGDAAAADDRPVADDEYLDPDKLLLFKHWIRPKFLQYHYLYDYRHNYYDDVIDYLDKRNRGYRRAIPQPQTWAERVLRTYNSNRSRDFSFEKRVEDTKLCEKMRLSGTFYRYHSREYINRRYFSLLN